MSLLAALQVQSSTSAPYIIIAFIAFTAAPYCDDTVYVCHDEAFLQPKA